MIIFEISITVFVMICLVLLFRKIGAGRISKGTVMALWNIILIRALMPYRIPIESSSALEKIQEKLPILNTPLVVAIRENQSESVQVISQRVMGQVSENNAGFPWMECLKWIWAGVSVCLALYFLFIYFQEHKALKKSVPIRHETGSRMIRESGIRRKIRLYAADSFTIPVTYGIFFPKIVLPSHLEAVSRLDMRNMIAHELEHIRVFDVGKRCLMILAVCLHWFNPLMWVMYRLYQEDQEMACDERVMGKMGEEAKTYIYTLIKMGTEGKSMIATTGFGGKDTGKRRILEALKKKKRGLGSLLATGGMLLCLLPAFVVFLTAEEQIPAVVFGETIEGQQEQTAELLQPRFEGVEDLSPYDESFDYDGVMQDIIENYNDPTKPLTEEQIKAIDMKSAISLAELYRERQKRGEKLTADEIWMIEEYGSVNVE